MKVSTKNLINPGHNSLSDGCTSLAGVMHGTPLLQARIAKPMPTIGTSYFKATSLPRNSHATIWTTS